jgi:hypothetical protein
LEAVDVKIGDDMVTLNFNTSDPDVISTNVKELETFISKNKKSINTENWEKSKYATKNLIKKWVDTDTSVKEAKKKYSAEILNNEDLFTDVEETYNTQMFGGGVVERTRMIPQYKEEVARTNHNETTTSILVETTPTSCGADASGARIARRTRASHRLRWGRLSKPWRVLRVRDGYIPHPRRHLHATLPVLRDPCGRPPAPASG